MLPPELWTEYDFLAFAMVKVVNSEQSRTEDEQASKGEPSPSECRTAESACFYGCPEQGGGSSYSTTQTCTLTFCCPASPPPWPTHLWL